MARIDWIEARLQEWAQRVSVGDGSGYSTMSVLHKDWMPPSGGVTPTLKVGRSSTEVKQTHAAIAQLPIRLRNTVVIHYCMRLPLMEQAKRLDCVCSTVIWRIDKAHSLLRELMNRSFTRY